MTWQKIPIIKIGSPEHYDSLVAQLNATLPASYMATHTTNTYSQHEGVLVSDSILITPTDEDSDDFFEVYMTGQVWHGAAHGPGYSRRLTANTLEEVLRQFGFMLSLQPIAPRELRREHLLLAVLISGFGSSGLTFMYSGSLGVGLAMIAVAFALSLILKLT